MPSTEKPSDQPIDEKEVSEDSESQIDDKEESAAQNSVEESGEDAPTRSAPENSQSASGDATSQDADTEGEPVVEGDTESNAEDLETEEVAPWAASAGPQRSRALPFAMGGFAAVAIGFLLAQALPDGWPRPPDQTLANELAALAAKTEDQAMTITLLNGRLDDLEEQIAALAARELPAFASPDDVAALNAQLSDANASLARRLTRIEAAVDTLEAIPPASDATGLSVDDIAEFRNELASVVADARAELNEARQAALLVEAEAARAARREAAFEALTRLRTSVDMGLGYAPALADLTEAAPVQPAEALTSASGDGIATMLELQLAFPDLARSAISASAVEPEGATAMERLGQFLRTQTNARSLSPREGTDADAVLSRAEAALNQSDLAATLAELATLPAPAAAVVEDWLATAQTRAAALAGLDDLAAQIDAM